jgi:F0F1-type ATP synthase assembly protein I
MPKPRKNPYQQEPEPVPGSSAHPPKPPPRSAVQAQLMRIGAIGTDFALAVIVSGILGWFADLALGTRPWLFMGGLLVGLLAGFYRFVREAMAENRKMGPRRP